MNLIYFIGFFPLISFFLLLFFQKILLNKHVSRISIFFLFLSFFCFLYVVYDYYNLCHRSTVFFIHGFHWITIFNYCIEFNYIIDFFSLSMLGTVLLISICVYLFSFWYMCDIKEYTKYFIYINLFVSFMIFFVLSSNLMSMFFAWEIIGVCSYLLIGFYYKKKKNGYAAIKSFLMTRIGDIFFLIAIFLILFRFHTLDFFILKYFIKEIVYLNSCTNDIFWITLFLMFAAIGKSAQVPLHTWLIGAMVGPTPASALIHAATMVTMGIYLIIRTYSFFLVNMHIAAVLSVIGCTTILISSISAVFEKNVKRILAFSTMSQIGYMFLALGTNNIKGAFIHLICHAFFKSLLFLSIGSLIKYLNNEQNIFKMGGLYKKTPFIYITCLIGSISLVSLPFFTSSFYSKGDILFHLMYKNEIWLLLCSFLGIFFTSIYVFRMVFFVFHGMNASSIIVIQKNFFYYLSLLILSLGCTPVTWYFLSHVFGNFFGKLNFSNLEFLYIEYISFGVSMAGFILAYVLYTKEKFFLKNKCIKKIVCLLKSATSHYWFFDFVYFRFLVRPYYMFSQYLNKKKFFYIENFFKKYLSVLRKKVFIIESISVIYHIKWYILCLTVNLLIIFLNKNY